MVVINESPTFKRYKDEMARCIALYLPQADPRDIDAALNYSIQKRYKPAEARIENSYTKRQSNLDLLKVADYIASRQPILTAFGTMFKYKGQVPNPMAEVVQSFLDLRTEYKKAMFRFPKGSEDFEKYNLLQSLAKIDANGLYGALGMYTSLIYNSNVATSITSQGRALVSSMTLQFEMFLANSVLFGSLDEVVQFIDNIVQEKRSRKYIDTEVLDNPNVSREDCFAKVCMSCGYRWFPSENEMEIIWRIINNLEQEDVNRVYYKNNLYEFISNSKIFNIIETMLVKLKRPLYNPMKIPDEIVNEIKLLTDLMMEYVYYKYMIIDRIDRCDNMIKSVTMVSDTDSTIISLDAWYRFVVEKVNGKELRIANYCKDPVLFAKKDEDGNWETRDWEKCVEFEPKRLDYNFETDEIVEMEHQNHPDIITPNDNVRYSIINILAFMLDRIINDYMEQFCLNNNSLHKLEDDYTLHINPYVADKVSFTKIWDDIEKGVDIPPIILPNHSYDHPCKIIAKNEFLFKRLLMTQVKKNYASIMELQEGNMVPKDKQLDIKGIECLTKSSKSEHTRAALQKILLEDILNTPVIDQLKFVKDMAIFERQIINSIKAGTKEYYKPATVKSQSAYSDPMRIQGIKASIAWNAVKPSDLVALNLDERNAVDIAKVKIDKSNVDKIAITHPEVYNNMIVALEMPEFKGTIDAIAVPMDVTVPDWLLEFVDYTEIVSSNIGGFPYESIGIMRMGKDGVNYTNIVEL